MGHIGPLGVSRSYRRPLQHEVLQDYCKAVYLLTLGMLRNPILYVRYRLDKWYMSCSRFTIDQDLGILFLIRYKFEHNIFYPQPNHSL